MFGESSQTIVKSNQFGAAVVNRQFSILVNSYALWAGVTGIFGFDAMDLRLNGVFGIRFRLCMRTALETLVQGGSQEIFPFETEWSSAAIERKRCTFGIPLKITC
jgi:hypothetical protein